MEYLRTNLEKYTQAKRDMTDDDLRIEDLNKSIKQELFNISSDWTEEFVTDFSDMISIMKTPGCSHASNTLTGSDKPATNDW